MKTKSFTHFATLAVTAAGLFALSAAAPAVAQSGPPPAPIIGVVNTDALLRESAAAKSVLAAREKYLSVYQTQAKDLSDKLRTEDQELGNQRNILAQEVWQEKAAAFQKKFAEAQGQVREKEGRLEYATNQAMQEVLNTLRVVAQSVAAERGVNLVIPQGTLLSFDPAMDLTAAVMTKLNARLPSVKFQDPDTIQVADEDKPDTAAKAPAKKK